MNDQRAFVTLVVALFASIAGWVLYDAHRLEIEKQHHLICRELYELRVAIVDGDISRTEVIAQNAEGSKCHTLGGQKWIINHKPGSNNDWWVASPIYTERDGFGGVWVLTFGLDVRLEGIGKGIPENWNQKDQSD